MISTKFFHECDPFLDGVTGRDIGVTGHSDSCVDHYYLVHRAEELGLSGVREFLGAGAVVVDVRGVFDAEVVEGMGFCYRTL